MAFGEKLITLREERGLTQEDLANHLYVSRSAVSKWETNKGYPSIDTIVAIQQLFGTSIDYLIGEEDIEGSFAARQCESRNLYLCAIASFAVAILFTALSLVVYKAGYIAWIVPLRVLAVIGVGGYIAFAFSSKAKYQPKPKGKASTVRLIAPRVILLIIIIAVIIMFLTGKISW